MRGEARRRMFCQPATNSMRRAVFISLPYCSFIYLPFFSMFAFSLFENVKIGVKPASLFAWNLFHRTCLETSFGEVCLNGKAKLNLS